ncbi:MAG: uroporphyrinogen decarboxylase [Capnocytophaga gingivalis]
MIDPQYIGYFASACIVLSFLMKNIQHIRLINLVGCLCFVIYGLMNTPQLWPVIIPNALICMVQVYYLWIKKEAH